MKNVFRVLTLIMLIFLGGFPVSMAVADMDTLIPIDRELQQNRALIGEDTEFVVWDDGQWWPRIGYITHHDIVNAFALQFDLSLYAGQTLERVKFRFFVDNTYQMLDTFLAVRVYESDMLLTDESYPVSQGHMIGGHHMYSGDALLSPLVAYGTPDAQPGVKWNIAQWVTYDVTDLVNARTSDHLFFNLRFAGDPPEDPTDLISGWDGNIMLDSPGDRYHYIQIASADNQPHLRPHLHVQASPMVYPTASPPATPGAGIIVRGKEYTAVGYDYGSILPFGQGFQNCVFEPDSGLLYVLDNNNEDQGGTVGLTDQIMIIDPSDGTILNAFNTPLAKTHSYCLTLGQNGNLIFAERGRTPIYEITTAGIVAGEYTIDIEDPPAPWPGVQRDGIAYNPNTDTYYITEHKFSRVTRNALGNFVRHESFETESFGCRAPRGMVYDANNNSLLIIDDSSDQVWEFALDGTLIAGGGSDTRSVEMPEYFSQANGIAFDPFTGRIFLTGVDTQEGHAILNVLTPVDPVIPPATGDLDGNGAVNQDDLIDILNCRNQPAEDCPGADMDGDGVITVLDARKTILACDRLRCATRECFDFTQEGGDLDESRLMTQVSNQSFFEYTAGPDHSTSVLFDLYLDGSLFAHVGPVPVGSTSGPIALPAHDGPLNLELRNVTCPPGVGSCIDGIVTGWGGQVCITP